MAQQLPATENFVKGIVRENPIFVQLLGMCPTLAVTNLLINGVAMGLATSFVLVCSSTMIAIIKKAVPHQVRIATYIVVIATFVTIADIFLKGSFPEISKSLGPFIPLIVVNCIILGRAEAFASRNTVRASLIDALGMGAGFTLALIVLSSVRELLGSGTLLGVTLLAPEFFEPWVVMILPGGAFLTLGLLLGLINFMSRRAQGKVEG